MIDLTLLAGLGTAPVITQLVQYAKEEWKVPSKVAPLLAIGFGIGMNVIIGILLNWELRDSFAMGILSGFGANMWYVKVTKEQS